MDDQEEFIGPDFKSPNSNVDTPDFFLHIYSYVTDLLVSYGWYFLLLALMTVLYWPSIRSYLDKWYEEKSNKEYTAKCKKNPDWLRTRELEMEAARKKMQEDLDTQAALFMAKKKEEEERKRSEASASTAGGQRLGADESGASNSSSRPNEQKSSSKTPIKKSYKPEYNPLMGSGGSGGYRPPRRGCPGGGCG